MSSDVVEIGAPLQRTHTSFHLRGSKSLSNRALVIAAQARSPSVLRNLSDSDDTAKMREALRSLGVTIEELDEVGTYRVVPALEQAAISQDLNVGPAGTVARFLSAFIATSEGLEATLHGTERMHQRPIGELINALCELGAKISYLENEGVLPLRIKGVQVVGGKVEIPADVSSQFISALLLVGARMREGIEVIPVGIVVSRSYIDMTCALLSTFGVKVEQAGDGCYRIPPGQVLGAEYSVEADASSAGYLWSLGTLMGGSVAVGPFFSEACQGDKAFVEVLSRLGAKVLASSQEITVSGISGRFGAIEQNMSEMPDAIPTLAVLAATADGVSQISGIETLRRKESDRVAALQMELSKVGVRSEATESVLTIFGQRVEELRPAIIQTYSDHRLAMSFAMLGTAVPGMRIEDPGVVTKSFPNFWECLAQFVEINRAN